MGRGKRKHPKSNTNKTRNRKHRSGEKHHNERKNTDNEYDHNNDFTDTPDSSQKSNGHSTTRHVRSTRKLFHKQKKHHQPSTESDDTQQRNSDMDTTDEETRKIKASVGRIEVSQDSTPEEIISVESETSEDTNAFLKRTENVNESGNEEEDSDDSLDLTKIIYKPPKKKDQSTNPDNNNAAIENSNNTKKPNETTTNKITRKVIINPPLEENNDTEMHSPPSTPINLTEPTPIDINKECRYSVTISIQPSPEPWKAFHTTLQQLLKLIQEQVHTKIHIATWDPELDETEKIIKTPNDFPEGAAKNRKHFANYFSGYPNPKRNKASKIYLKVRFTTPEPEKLPFTLANMGQEL